MRQVEFNYKADSNTGLKRTNNEDAYGHAKTKFGSVFIVCDGMGGHAAGERASEIAVSVICDYLANSESDNFPHEIEQAIKHANKSIWEEASNDASLKGMGTTCVVVYLTEKGEVFIGHVGDSRCYLYAKNTGLKTLTKDHSYVQFLIEVGEVTEDQAFDHPNKNRILKALGIDEDVSPDVTESPLKPASDTLFLLCTDGLNDMLRDQEIESYLTTSEPLEKQVNQLIDAALKKGGKDNVTLGLLHITSNPFYSSTDETAHIISSSTDAVKSKKNFKKLLLILLILALVGLSYFLFKPVNLDETIQNDSVIEENNQLEQTDALPIDPQEEAENENTDLIEDNPLIERQRQQLVDTVEETNEPAADSLEKEIEPIIEQNQQEADKVDEISPVAADTIKETLNDTIQD